MLPAVNTTGLPGFDSGSLQGTVPMDQVFALCEAFMDGGNHSVAVTLSSGNYSLVIDMTVQAAAGCEAEDEDVPLQAWQVLLAQTNVPYLPTCLPFSICAAAFPIPITFKEYCPTSRGKAVGDPRW